MKLLLKNGHLVDPARGIDARRDILIDAGRVARVEETILDADARVIDLTGKVVAPGFIDMHVHLREPGREDAETIESGMRAAAAGGFTSIACMPNTDPPNDNASITQFIRKQAAVAGGVNVYPIGCVSHGRRGESLAEIGEMVESGIVAVSDDGDPVADGRLLRQALEYCKMFSIPVIDHCEDRALAGSGVMHEGFLSTRLGLPGMPAAAEELHAFRDATGARYVGGRIHIAHLSTAGAVEIVRTAKAAGTAITCEVTPHHLILTDEVVAGFDPNTKMKPPLRGEADRAAVIEGLRDGTIDAIATDHAPHNILDKETEFDQAAFGIVGLETAVPLLLDRLVGKDVIGLSRLVELFTTGPARALNLKKGSLAPGDDADLTVLDLKRQVEIDAGRMRSRSRNSPFLGWSLRGAAVMTIVGGAVSFEAGD